MEDTTCRVFHLTCWQMPWAAARKGPGSKFMAQTSYPTAAATLEMAEAVQNVPEEAEGSLGQTEGSVGCIFEMAKVEH